MTKHYYKYTKTEVDYTPNAMKKDERCALCMHYEGNEICEIVRGDISPLGWCNKFERDAA